MKSFDRPSWDEYFMSLAQVVKTRGNCIRQKVGAVVEKDRRIIATGYNGTPQGIPNCFEGGCDRCRAREDGQLERGQDKDKCVCIHAEQNAIIQSAYHGISTKDAEMYTTLSPCSQCAKVIINAGIRRIVCGGKYHDENGIELLKKAKIEVVIKST